MLARSWSIGRAGARGWPRAANHAAVPPAKRRSTLSGLTIQGPRGSRYFANTMVFTETEVAAPNPRYPFGRMDARTVARAAKVKVGTLNAWVQRGLVPGMTIGPSGRRRNIDIDTATRIIAIAELVNFGIPPDKASSILAGVTPDTGLLLIGYNDSPGQGPYTVTTVAMPPGSHPLRALLAGRDSRRDAGWTDSSLIIWVASLRERARDAEAQWQKEQGGAP